MGNTTSAIRGSRVDGQPPRDADREPPVTTHPMDQPLTLRRSMVSNSRHSNLPESWRRQAQRAPADAQPNRQSDDIQDRSYDQEDRLLFPGNHDRYVETHPVRPLNWRHSTMSRLGSRLLPESVARGLMNSGEETPEEGQALRQGLSSRSRPSVYHRRITSVSNDRFSITGSFRRRNMEPRNETNRGVVRRLFTSSTDRQPLENDMEVFGVPVLRSFCEVMLPMWQNLFPGRASK